MKNIKIFNVEFDGIDKCGKDTIKPLIWYFAPGLYLSRARGLISQIAYAKLYNRDVNYEIDAGYVKNTLFVLLDVNEDDWNVRCKLTNEPKSDFTYDEMRKAFIFAIRYLKDRFDIPDERILIFNTSQITSFNIAKEVTARLEQLNDKT